MRKKIYQAMLENRNKELLRQGEEIHRLRQIEEEHAELDAFLAWLNKMCAEMQLTFCGLTKIYLNPEKTKGCYIGFVLDGAVHLNPEREYKFTLRGYSSKDMAFANMVYIANFYLNVRPPEYDIEKAICIEDHYVRPDELKDHGIGTAAMGIIKETAKHLRGLYIYGDSKDPYDTEEKAARRRRFYEKNGFKQEEDSAGIVHVRFDMGEYEKDKKTF